MELSQYRNSTAYRRVGHCRYDYYDTNGGSIDVVGAYFFADEASWTAFANSQNSELNK